MLVVILKWYKIFSKIGIVTRPIKRHNRALLQRNNEKKKSHKTFNRIFVFNCFCIYRCIFYFHTRTWFDRAPSIFDRILSTYGIRIVYDSGSLLNACYFTSFNVFATKFRMEQTIPSYLGEIGICDVFERLKWQLWCATFTLSIAKEGFINDWTDGWWNSQSYR